MRPLLMPVYGTRPEAIKMAPLLNAIRERQSLSARVVVTGQHREMLDQVNRLFGIVPDVDLDIFQDGQSLEQVTARTLERLSAAIDDVRPDAVVVQGDTSSAFAAALAAFYRKVPVFHVEAGLRSANPLSPFPEEMNRRLTSQLAALHLAPTPESRDNLLREHIADDTVVVTGNTVIDALLAAVERRVALSDPALAAALTPGRRMVLVTTHRRESWGERMAGVARALVRLARAVPDVLVVLPLHANPVVRRTLLPVLRDEPNVVLTEPLPYGEFAHLIERATVVLTDSGGIQEEAPSLGKPVLVMRENTERPEAVAFGTAKLVGTDEERILAEARTLLTEDDAYARMATAVNPYGDGHAAARSVAAFESYFGLGARLPDFAPQAAPVVTSA